MLILIAWLLTAMGVYLNLCATAHYRGFFGRAPNAEVWLFPDREFARLPNTTLYNLTYGVR